jgi:hypothetical protein
MVEPFYIVGNGEPDMRTVYQNLENGGYTNAMAFERALVSIPAKCLEKEKGAHYTSARQRPKLAISYSHYPTSSRREADGRVTKEDVHSVSSSSSSRYLPFSRLQPLQPL